MTLKRSILAATVVVIVVVVASVTVSSRERPKRGTPEAAAETVFHDLRWGNFNGAFSRISPGGITAETQMRERRYHLRWWRLVDRRVQGKQCRLEYTTVRGWLPISSPVWLTLEEQDGRWRVTTFSGAY